jgi:hypothetical protein
MFDMKTRETKDAEYEAKKVAGFQRFMAKPETKLMVSMIPPAEQQPEALETLLRIAFDAGHNAGTGDVVGEMLVAMLKAPKDRS